MDRLLLYHDFVSPYCRLAVAVTLDVAARAGLELRPVPFELYPAPVERPPPGSPELDDQLESARAVARDWGLELGSLPRVPRTRKAHEMVMYALGREDPAVVASVLRGLYGALWADGRDIARLDVLVEIGEAAGLERDPLHVALGLDDLEAAVVREQDAAAGAGIAGVPAVQVGSVLATGLIPADDLLEWVEANR